MEQQAVVLKSGLVVRVKTTNYPNGLEDVYMTVTDGMVTSFKYNNILYWYCNHRGPDYVTSSGREPQHLDGYYIYEEYLEYKLNKKRSYEVTKFNFDETKDKALEGDLITTLRNIFISDYSHIYTKNYNFEYDGTTVFKDTVTVPDEATGTVIWDEASLEEGPSGFFLTNYEIVLKNNLRGASNFPSIFQGTVLVMRNIVLDIFPLFSANNQSDISAIVNAWDNLNYYVGDEEESIINAANQITDLYNALKEFRANFYAYKTSIIEKTGNNLVLFLVELAKVAPAQALEAIDVRTKYKMLCEMVKGSMTQFNSLEFAALCVVESVTDTQVDDFLPLLLTEVQLNDDPSENKTLFELLFNKIDDNRSGRYTFGIFNTENNRAIFIITVYKLWRKSVYNPTYHHPSYQYAAVDGIYPESFYMELEPEPGSSIPKSKYYDEEISPPLISYEAPPQDNLSNCFSYSESEVSYDAKMENSKIKIYERITTYTKDYDFKYSSGKGSAVVQTKLYGTYDFYQPVSVIGFKPDLGLLQTFKSFEFGEDLQEEIPAFFLFYMVDYNNLSKLDFSVMLC